MIKKVNKELFPAKPVCQVAKDQGAQYGTYEKTAHHQRSLLGGKLEGFCHWL
jgi:hypothetical protein